MARTKQGSMVSSLNALKHGLYARQLVVPGEHRREFNAWRGRMLEEVRPGNARELGLFERILSASWKLRRMEGAEVKLYEPPEYPCVREVDERRLLRMSDEQRQRFFDDLERRRRAWREALVEHAATRTAERFGDIKDVECHQIRLGNAASRAWRELDALRKAEGQTEGDKEREAFMEELRKGWKREEHTARQRSYRSRQAREKREACRRERDAKAMLARAREGASATGSQGVVTRPGELQPRTRQVLEAAVAAARAEGMEPTIDLDKVRPYVGKSGNEFTCNGDNPVVIAPNGKPVHREVLALLIRTNPEAVELQPPVVLYGAPRVGGEERREPRMNTDGHGWKASQRDGGHGGHGGHGGRGSGSL